MVKLNQQSKDFLKCFNSRKNRKVSDRLVCVARIWIDNSFSLVDIHAALSHFSMSAIQRASKALLEIRTPRQNRRPLGLSKSKTPHFEKSQEECGNLKKMDISNVKEDMKISSVETNEESQSNIVGLNKNNNSMHINVFDKKVFVLFF